MTIFFTILGLAIVCGILNRMRGDDRWMHRDFTETGPKWLPGRALYYVAPVIGLVSLIVLDWRMAATIAVGYFFWAVFPWGMILLRAAGLPPTRKPEALERVLLRLPGRFLPVLVRMMFVLPMTLALGWLRTPSGLGLVGGSIVGMEFAILTALTYRWLFNPISKNDWLFAEVATGCMWGILIWAMAL